MSLYLSLSLIKKNRNAIKDQIPISSNIFKKINSIIYKKKTKKKPIKDYKNETHTVVPVTNLCSHIRDPLF